VYNGIGHDTRAASQDCCAPICGSNQTPTILVGKLSFPAVQIKDCCLRMPINWVQLLCDNGYNGVL